jgi:hypothetical protein
MPGSGGRESGFSPRVELAWRLALWLTLLFKEFSLPARAATPGLDESWQAVKGWQLLQGTALGTESVFTYGPLGWFYAAPHMPELMAAKLWGFELCIKGLCALACVDLVATFRGWSSRLLTALALLWIPAGLDAFALIAIAGIGLLLIRKPELPRAREALFLLAAVLLAQVKFSYLMLYALMIFCITLASERRRAVRLAALGLGLFLGTWLALGQSLITLPQYLRTSLSIASGYNEAMSANGPALELRLALLSLGTLAALALIQGWTSRNGRSALAGCALTLGAAFLAFKAGFTRHMGNSMILFACAPVFGAWLQLAGASGWRRQLQPLAVVFLLVLAALGYQSSVSRPGQARRYWEEMKEYHLARIQEWRALPELRASRDRGMQGIARFYDLPRIRAIVGNERVDVIHSAAAIALINGFNYAPRPVFQSYAAYTPLLSELNRAYFTGERAPRFVLLRHDRIDDRLPVLDDAPALLEILRRYEPRLGEKGYVLLEKRAGEPPPLHRATILRRTLRLGEWIDLSEWKQEALWMRVRWQTPLQGRLRSFFLHAAPLRVELEFSDGRSASHRLCRGPASDGFLLRPFAEDQDGWCRLFSGQPGPEVTRLRLAAPEGLEAFLPPSAEIELESLSGLLPAPDPDALARMTYTCIDPLPLEVSSNGPLRQFEIEGRFGLSFGAPGALIFALQPGEHRLQARYGLLKEAWAGNCTDGVSFQFVLEPQSGNLKVLHLDPILTPSSEARSVDLPFTVDQPSRLILRCTTGPAGDGGCDWAYWQEVRVHKP